MGQHHALPLLVTCLESRCPELCPWRTSFFFQTNLLSSARWTAESNCTRLQNHIIYIYYIIIHIYIEVTYHLYPLITIMRSHVWHLQKSSKLFRLGWINPLNIALVKSYQPEWTMRLLGTWSRWDWHMPCWCFWLFSCLLTCNLSIWVRIAAETRAIAPGIIAMSTSSRTFANEFSRWCNVDAIVPDCTMYHDLQHGIILSNTLLHCLNFGLCVAKKKTCWTCCRSKPISSSQMPHVQDYLIPLSELKPMLDVGDDALGTACRFRCASFTATSNQNLYNDYA